ncbi:Uncharacterised protein [Mycobacteroides abscessus subsp. abscessus]|nr:Uncharacterised protein [Mycobacteroides abscessus subsp. abscessus]
MSLGPSDHDRNIRNGAPSFHRSCAYDQPASHKPSPCHPIPLLSPSGDERIREFTAGHPERSIGWLRHDVEGTTFLGGVTNGSAADLVRLAAVAVEAIETGGVIRDGVVCNVWAPATKP